jgi:predicted DNA-binding ribbon-helix-helix protein
MLRKRSLTLAGHATSLALEPEFWTALHKMAEARKLSLAAVVAEIDSTRRNQPLASACRVAALGWRGAAVER